MHLHRRLFIPVVALATLVALPISAAAQCTGLAEIYGNDAIVTQATSNITFSYYAIGNALQVVWNEAGATPSPHAAGQYRAIFTAGVLLHELGHQLGLDHGGPASLANNASILFVASDNGRLYKIDAQTGSAVAFVDLRRPTCPDDKLVGTPAVQLYRYANPAFQTAISAERGFPDDLVFVVIHHGCGGLNDDQIVALYASDLTTRWVFNSTGSFSVGDSQDGCTVDYSTNQVYCGTDQTQPGQPTLWALQSLPSSATGSVVWSTNAGTIANRPIVKPSGGGELYVVKTDGTILLLDPASGSTVWSLPNSASVVRNVWPEFRGTQPTRIYYTTSDGFFHGVLNNFPAPVPLFTPVSPGTGTKFSTMPTVVPSLGKIYLGRDDGRVQQLSQSDGSAECSVVAGIPGTLGDPAQDFSSSNAPDVDRITITTATGSIRRYGIPWSTTGVSAAAPVAEFTLGQNAPNPFATDTRIDYRLPWDARVEVDIFAVDGRRTRRLVREQEPAGAHQAIWDGLDDAGRAVASGPYFYRLRATGSSGRTLESSKKIQVVR